MTSGEASPLELLADRYQLVRLLGEGGMGSVWEARNVVTGKIVAVKRMARELSSDASAVERFLREARAATSLSHPNVVEVFDVGVHDGAPFMILEYLNGEPFSSLRERFGKLDAAALTQLLMPVLRALAVAHERGIVHRDIKPENIFLARRGNRLIPKLLDFGISKMLADGDFRLTQTGAVLGTPYYMAPEQAAGKSSLDHRADVYSIAVLFFEALSGRVPFSADNYNSLIVSILTAEIPRLGALEGSVSDAVSEVVAKGMARNPDDRYGTIEEFAIAFEDAAGLSGLWASAPESSPLPAGDPGAFDASKTELAPSGSGGLVSPMAATALGGAATTLGGGIQERRTPLEARPKKPNQRLAVFAAFGVALLGVGAWAFKPKGEAATPELASPGADRFSRAAACAAEHQDRCVVDLLQGAIGRPEEAELLFASYKRLGDRVAASDLARVYLSRWPHAQGAATMSAWLAATTPDATGAVSPASSALVKEPAPAPSVARSATRHTAQANADERAARGVASATPAQAPTEKAPAAAPEASSKHRSGKLDASEF